MARVTCTLKPDGRGFEVAAEITFAAAHSPGQVAVLEPGQPDVWIGDAMQPHRWPHGLRPRPDPGARARPARCWSGDALRLTVLDESRAVDIQRLRGAPG